LMSKHKKSKILKRQSLTSKGFLPAPKKYK
jgi:hypothetical protein